MSFRNTKTPNKPTTPAKWQIPTRSKYKAGKDEYYLEGELKERFCKTLPQELQPPHDDVVRHRLFHPATLQARVGA